jgi:hypothetical protein
LLKVRNAVAVGKFWMMLEVIRITQKPVAAVQKQLKVRDNA